MHPIVYDVAVSIDGYISGPDGDISRFAQDGPVVEDYLARLGTYAVAIMGRRTYEFGYRFGLKPGLNPYPHMETHVFSASLNLPEEREVSVHPGRDAHWFGKIKVSSSGPIYLCGGGAFAAALLSMGVIDILRLKRTPVLLGSGVRLFGDADAAPRLRHVETRNYDGGYALQEFAVQPRTPPMSA